MCILFSGRIYVILIYIWILLICEFHKLKFCIAIYLLYGLDVEISCVLKYIHFQLKLTCPISHVWLNGWTNKLNSTSGNDSDLHLGGIHLKYQLWNWLSWVWLYVVSRHLSRQLSVMTIVLLSMSFPIHNYHPITRGYSLN